MYYFSDVAISIRFRWKIWKRKLERESQRNQLIELRETKKLIAISLTIWGNLKGFQLVCPNCLTLTTAYPTTIKEYRHGSISCSSPSSSPWSRTQVTFWHYYQAQEKCQCTLVQSILCCCAWANIICLSFPILVLTVAILLASATDRELWQVPTGLVLVGWWDAKESNLEMIKSLQTFSSFAAAQLPESPRFAYSKIGTRMLVSHQPLHWLLAQARS